MVFDRALRRMAANLATRADNQAKNNAKNHGLRRELFQAYFGGFPQEECRKVIVRSNADAVKAVAAPVAAVPRKLVSALSWQQMLDGASRIAGWRRPRSGRCP